jgi:hypothetical protein
MSLCLVAQERCGAFDNAKLLCRCAHQQHQQGMGPVHTVWVVSTFWVPNVSAARVASHRAHLQHGRCVT